MIQDVASSEVVPRDTQTDTDRQRGTERERERGVGRDSGLIKCGSRSNDYRRLTPSTTYSIVLARRRHTLNSILFTQYPLGGLRTSSTFSRRRQQILDLKDTMIPNYSTELYINGLSFPILCSSTTDFSCIVIFFHLLCILCYVNLMSCLKFMHVRYVFIKRD